MTDKAPELLPEQPHQIAGFPNTLMAWEDPTQHPGSGEYMVNNDPELPECIGPGVKYIRFDKAVSVEALREKILAISLNDYWPSGKYASALIARVIELLDEQTREGK